ncbi:hypothetical protein ACUNV4_14650 [Granulosicoccus sp. 3-233]|uniref:hypothetical protein n=1 Tax=Granulosicoccus sp. 3-233 TaxID=3417969 RepID=UPI003D33487D
MPQAAVEKKQLPANDAEYGDDADVEQAGEEARRPRSTADNPVKRAVEEFSDLINEMDDIREMLRAHGVPLRTTRMIVEFGVQKKPDKQAVAIDSAMEQAESAFGQGGLSRQALENHISTIVNLELDLNHARSVAREEGLDAKALSTLTQMVQQNPGDGGAKAVNTFLAYALACGIKTDQLSDIAGNLLRQPASVLPQIPRRKVEAPSWSGKRLVRDVLTGLLIGIAVIALLL